MLLHMKKLAALVAVSCLSIAAPVFACPGHSESTTEAPRTAEKDKADKTEKTDKTAKTEKAKTEKTEKKDTAKKPDKVSSK